MTDLILHHYPMSPFSEKIRAMLGYSDMNWQSVRVPEMPPRRKLAHLAGGYRRIPVAQMGADVFCDTRIIASEIATLAQRPQLALINLEPEQQDFVRESDLEVFLACILSANGKVLFGKLWRDTSTLHVLRFLFDRINMGRKARVSAAGPKQAKQIVRRQMQRIEAMLQQDFLFGDAPTAADFAAYHGLWFLRDPGEARYFAEYSRVSAWMDRIAAFGHGRATDISIDEALDIAQSVAPRPLPESSVDQALLGATVTVCPDDYGRDPVRGVLRAATAERWIVGREDSRCGSLNLHFPRHGFVLSAV